MEIKNNVQASSIFMCCSRIMEGCTWSPTILRLGPWYSNNDCLVLKKTFPKPFLLSRNTDSAGDIFLCWRVRGQCSLRLLPSADKIGTDVICSSFTPRFHMLCSSDRHSCYELVISVSAPNHPGHSPLTSLINKVFLSTELPLGLRC